MRHYVVAAVLALSLGGFAPLISAQDQQESQATRRVVSRVVPLYPDLARKMHLEGTVKVEVVVAPNGTPKSNQVIGGNPVLASAAIDAINKWRWAPAPQETKELIELRFHP